MELKVGDRVCRIDNPAAQGTVTEVEISPIVNYPVKIKWDKTVDISTVTLDGRYWKSHKPLIKLIEPNITTPEIGQVWERLENHPVTAYKKKGERITIIDVCNVSKKVTWERYNALPMSEFIERFKLVTEISLIEAVKETIDNTRKKENQMKQRDNGNFRVFDKKGNVHKEGLLHQCAKFGLTDKRPFVRELIEKEADRIIKSQTIKGMLTRVDNTLANYNLLAAGLIATSIDTKITIESPDNTGKISIDIKVSTALNILRYNKELSKKYMWIADYLTKENMNKKHVVLFSSNKIKISLTNGTLCATFFRKMHNEEFVIEHNFKFPVKYNEELKQFHI